MPLMNMERMLKDATANGYAVGAFNIFNHLTAAAVIQAAEENRAPVIIQVSTKTVKQMGLNDCVETVSRLAAKASVPVALHLDHCTDFMLAKSCADAGFTSIMFDGSHLPFEENIKFTADMAAYAAPLDISVEGELGAIAGVEDDIAVADDAALLAEVETSKEFVRCTGVTAFAPAVGTAHGLYKKTPVVDFQRFADIKEVCDCPLVVHGGTGLSDETFRKLISLGASKINISTAIKVAYLGASEDFWKKHQDESNPFVLDNTLTQAVKETVRIHILLFGSDRKA